MNTLLVHIARSSWFVGRRFARRIATFNNSCIRRQVKALLPLWDGTDPALRGLTARRGTVR